VNSKREKVKEMMKFAWKGYAENAWGFNELNSELGVPHNDSVFGSHHIGLSIIDSLDTLYIMGLHEEYERGRKWVADNFTLDNIDGYLSVYELTVRIAGGLLSMYAMTGDDVYKKMFKSDHSLKRYKQIKCAISERADLLHAYLHLPPSLFS